MNSINAAQREREAAIQQADAEKIRLVKEAEGQAEAKRLAGKGVADQRKEIANGIAEQCEMLRKAGVKDNPEALLLETQRLDANVDMAKNSNGTIIFVPQESSEFSSLRNSMISSQLIGQDHNITTSTERPHQ